MIAVLNPFGLMVCAYLSAIRGGDLVHEDVVNECRCCCQIDDAALGEATTSRIRYATASVSTTEVHYGKATGALSERHDASKHLPQEWRRMTLLGERLAFVRVSWAPRFQLASELAMAPRPR